MHQVARYRSSLQTLASWHTGGPTQALVTVTAQSRAVLAVARAVTRPSFAHIACSVCPWRTERPEWLAAKLEKYVHYTTQFLHDATETSILSRDEVAGRDMVKLAAMPRTAAVHAHALLFVYRKKKGALASFLHERSFLIKKMVKPDGSVVWSGPVFMKGRTWGLGFTGGFMKMRMCMALVNDKAIDRMLRPQSLWGVNASFLVDMNGSRIRRLHTSSSGSASAVETGPEGGMWAKYYLLEAGMIDLSVRGGRHVVDDALNRAVYGEDVDVKDVLDCRVPPPPEFAPVYAMLQEFARDTKSVHARVSAVDRSFHGGLRGSRTSSAEALAGAEAAAKAAAAGAAVQRTSPPSPGVPRPGGAVRRPSPPSPSAAAGPAAG